MVVGYLVFSTQASVYLGRAVCVPLMNIRGSSLVLLIRHEFQVEGYLKIWMFTMLK